MADEKKLIRKRGTLKTKLTYLEKYIEELKKASEQNKSIYTEIELKIGLAETMFREFTINQTEIENICDEGKLNENSEEGEIFESRYVKAVGFLKQYIKEENSENNSLPPPQNVTIHNVSNQNPLQNILIPKVKIPTFSGEAECWLDFKNSFLTNIHNVEGINNFQKYQILQASVDGYAKRLIKYDQINEHTYEIAWNSLCDTYDRKKTLIDSHLKAIFNIPSIQKESSNLFNKFLHDISGHLSALDGLEVSKKVLWETSIIYHLANKLDKHTLRKWKECNHDQELPSLQEFLEFIKNRVDILNSIEDDSSKKDDSFKKQFGNKFPNKQRVNLTLKIKCNFCNKEHLIYHCKEFLKLDAKSRRETVKRLILCENCLKTGHQKETCIRGPCRKCYEKHNTLLHTENTAINVSLDNTTQNIGNTSVFSINNTNYKQILLSTVVCFVKNLSGENIQCRALLDSGAQSNLLTAEFCSKLQLPTIPTNMSIVGINQVSSVLNKKCNISISSKIGKYKTNICCYIVPNISNDLPDQTVYTNNWNIPKHLELADSEFFKPHPIDMLIGSQLFWDLIIDGKISLGKGLPILHNTKFGWIISGSVGNFPQTSVCNFLKIIPEDEQLKRSWELEEIDISSDFTKEDAQCEQLFKETTSRDAQGRFVVQFPFKHSPGILGDTKEIAKKRFYNLERKLESNSKLKSMYHDFIHEYISLGHMSKISDDNLNETSSYYLPHHGVFKDDNITTKLRVVFDGSCASTSGWSLNDLQLTGPKLQNDIFNILLRFRCHKFVVSSDISKMYRQIIMHEKHRQFQKIIWRSDSSTEPSTYELSTVTYGTSSAPFLAIRCLQELAYINKDLFPESSAVILSDFYVDDLITGSDSLETLKNTCHEIYSMLEDGGFILRKWLTNEPSILSDLKIEHVSNAILNLGEGEGAKTLGLRWYNHDDILKYRVPTLKIPPVFSKRNILADIAQLYDPLGLLAPCIILFKMLIQTLWTKKLSWDEPVSDDLSSNWLRIKNNLNKLNDIEIPRRGIGLNCRPLELHCFCDASQKAYATCIYLRSQNSDGDCFSHLLCSKTKVAPIKTISIPRLELCAALLGAQLFKKVISSLPYSLPCVFWSDSLVVLSWIRSDSNKYQIFVANRIAQIQSLTKVEDWHYINTKENPADLASRGIQPQSLLNSVLWWQGPNFLTQKENKWPIYDPCECIDELPELKRATNKIFTTTISNYNKIFSQCSKLYKLQRAIAYWIRYFKNKQLSKETRKVGYLSTEEIQRAHMGLIKFAQKECFEDAIRSLSTKGFLAKGNSLISLSPFIDDNQILRVGGRLKLSSLDMNVVHPILLSAKHPLTKLIFITKHEDLLHAGPQLLLADIRQTFWVIGGRNLAKKTVHECIRCFKFNPKTTNIPIGQLPQKRITPSLPFVTTGLDYAGPFLIKDRTLRNAKLVKCYLCIFVCFCTKSVHLELVSDLTSEYFLASLKRFIARRGIPSDIYSDNGTTFVGARNELLKLEKFLKDHSKVIQDFCIFKNINWHFIPPYSPNFGGLWEAAVKSAKYHLKRVTHNITLTYEEFNTLIIQIEGILNSRPLFAMSSDPNDLQPLTPSHFLIGRSINTLPEFDFNRIPNNRLTSLEAVQKHRNSFWIRFNTEYITKLAQSYKWSDHGSKIDKDALVLVKDLKSPPNRWLTGRILDLHPGKDGVARVATIKTTTGIIKRSIRSLCPLPLAPSNE